MSSEATTFGGEDPAFLEAACGLLVTDRHGTILRVNATFCRWIGYDPAELIGQRRMQDLLTMGGRIFHQTHWLPLIVMQGSIAELKLELVHKDGQIFPALINATVRHEAALEMHDVAVFMATDRQKYEGELLRARMRAEELLQQQQETQRGLILAEARLRVAVDAAHLFIWHVDLDTGLRYYDDDVALLLGMDIPQPVSAGQMDVQTHPDDRNADAHAFQQALVHQKGSYRCVYRILGLDHVERTVLATGTVIFGPDRAASQFVGVLQDITELTRQRNDAEIRARFAEQMLGIASHDLRNPLTSILLGVDRLAQDELTERQYRVLGHIDLSAKRARRLIGDLLDLTLVRAGRGLTVTPGPIDLHEVVSAGVDEWVQTFPERALVHRAFGTGPCEADADRLFQLIGNLLANAMAYGDPACTITVTSTIEAATFSVTVHNHGAPIPAHLLPGLFEPMTRGTLANVVAQSVGLGLFIVRQIAQAHGGDVRVLSSLEKGTTFSATFPAVVPVPAT